MKRWIKMEGYLQKSIIIICGILGSLIVNGQTVNTWKGGSNGAWNNTGNWSLARIPISTDVVTFDGNNIDGSNTHGASLTITSIPNGTNTIGQLVLVNNNVSVSLQALSGGSSTLTVGSSNYSSDEISVPSGCSLILATNASGVTTETLTLGLANVSGVTANIAGTLTIQPNATTTASGAVAYSHRATYSTNQLVTNNGELYTVTAAGTTSYTGNGPGVISGTVADSTVTFSYLGTLLNGSYATAYNNAYDAHYGVTYISGTVNYAGKFNNTSALGTSTNTLQFLNVSTFNNQRYDAAFPGNGSSTTTNAPTYNNVNVNITGIQYVSGNVYTYQFPASVSTLNFNCTGMTGGILRPSSLSDGSTTLNAVNISLNMGTGSNTWPYTNFGHINISNNLTINTGSMALGAGGATTVTINGTLSIPSTGTIYTGATSTDSIVVNNFSLTGSGSFSFSGTGAQFFTVLGNFTKTAGTFSVSNPAKIRFAGNAPQVVNISSFPVNATIEIANTGSAGNNTVSLSQATSFAGPVTLTSGHLVLGNYNLTMASTATLTSTPTSASYIDASGSGLLVWQSVPSTGNVIFPIGTATSYAPLTLTGGTAGANITVGVKNSFTHALNTPNNAVNLQWSILASSATKPTVTFQYNSIDQGSGYTPTGVVLGNYTGSAYTESGFLAINGSNPFTVTNVFTGNLPTGTASLFGIGNAGTFFGPTITFNNINKNYGASAFGISATSNSAGAITYTSSNASIATVSGSAVTIVGVGTDTLTATQAANGAYVGGSRMAILTVNPIAPTLGTFSVSSQSFGAAPFTLTAPTSNSGGAFTFTSNNNSIATISGNTVTIVGIGTDTITAIQAANGNYTSTSIITIFTVTPIAPTIGTFSVATQNYGAAPFTLTAPTSNSGGAFTYTSSNNSIATISGNTVTIVGVGTDTITATQAANGNYTSISTTAIFTVSPIAPTIGTLSVATQNYGVAPFTLTAPSSNSSGAFTYFSSNNSIATISGNTVAIVGIGTDTITATQAANGNYISGNTVAIFTVNAIAPTISMGNINKNYGVAPFPITASSNSGGAFTYTSSNSSIATVSGNTVTIVGIGTDTITATQTANGNYLGGSIKAILTVNPIAPTIGTFSVSAKNYGAAPFTLTAPSSNSGGAFSYLSSNSSIATISGNTVTIVGIGTDTITAIQSANGGFTSGSVTTILTVNPIAPSIGTFSISAKNYGTAPFTLSAPSSNSTGAFTYTSSNNSIATINGNTITIVGVGTDTITAIQAANGGYTSGSIMAILTVNPVAPTIGTFSMAAQNYGAAPFTITAPSSNSAGAFTYISSNNSIATINGNTVTIVGIGTDTITAIQTANGGYTSGSVSAIFSVNPIAPTIGTFSIPTQNYGIAPFSIAAPTSNSNGSFTYVSSNTSIATISGNVVTIVGIGTDTITAFQTANGNYTSGTITTILTVNPIAPTIGTFSIPTQSYGVSPISLTAPTSSSNGSFTYTSSNSSIATISGNSVTIVGIGTDTITAIQAAYGGFTSGTKTTTLTVNPIAPSLSLANMNKNYGNSPFSITANSNSSGAITYTSSNSSIATISGNTVTIVGVGTDTISVSQSANGVYTSGTITAILTVSAVVPGIPTIVNANPAIGAAVINFTAPSFNGGATITSYTITANPGNLTASGASSPITFNGLTNGVSYTFTVQATNSIG